MFFLMQANGLSEAPGRCGEMSEAYFATSFGGMVSCRFRSTFLSSYNYFWYELCSSNTHCTGN